MAAPRLTLYEMGTSRSARCRWALAECGLEATFVSAKPGSAEAKAVHPMGKLPALLIEDDAGGRATIFESAAIVSYVADLAASLGGDAATPLIAPSGTLARAQHEQWVSFALTELDAWLWHDFVQKFQPDALESAEQDARLWKRGGAALEAHLAQHEYVVGDTFSVADCVVGWSVNWARRSGLLEGEPGFPNIAAYLARLLERPHCALAKD